jgi:hypothetical protein
MNVGLGHELEIGSLDVLSFVGLRMVTHSRWHGSQRPARDGALAADPRSMDVMRWAQSETMAISIFFSGVLKGGHR